MPAEYAIRSPTREDVPAIVDALNAHSRAAFGADDATVEEVGSWFDHPGLDPAADMRVAVTADGAVAAYADLGGGHEDDGPLHVDLRARPGAVEAASLLLRVIETRAAERGSPPRPLRAFAHGTDEEGQALLDRAGYGLVRRSYRMEIALDRDPPAPSWPPGLATATFVPGVDDERVYEAQMDAFADHWGFNRAPYDQWRHEAFRDGFDPSLWFVVRAGDEIAAVCLCRAAATAEPEVGWVSDLGVRVPWRRRGVATALLLHAFHALRDRGCVRVALGVDAENTTGAVLLYERVGMHVVRWSLVYERHG